MAARRTSFSVSPPWWDECWIVAHGPSARQFDLGRLTGKQVIAVNDFLPCFPPHLVAICSADTPWVGRHKYVLDEYEGEMFFATANGIIVQGATHLNRCHEPGLSEQPDAVCTGGNSGYMAINVACLKQARTIHLIGFDMDPNARGADGEKFREWAPRFRSMLPQLERAGIQVFNHNPNSAIDAFPKGDF